MQEKAWDADATFPGGQTSHDVLLAWLAVRENYTRWHNGRGSTRAALVRRIAVEIQLVGLPARTTRDVRSKIDAFETSMRRAIEWKQRYGEQILKRRGGDPDGAAEVRAGLSRICPAYETLAPSMLTLLEKQVEHTAAMALVIAAKRKKEAATFRFAPTARPHRALRTPTPTSTPTATPTATSAPSATSAPAPTPTRMPQSPSQVEDDHEASASAAAVPSQPMTRSSAAAAASTFTHPPAPIPIPTRPQPTSMPASASALETARSTTATTTKQPLPTTRVHVPRSPVDLLNAEDGRRAMVMAAKGATQRLYSGAPSQAHAPGKATPQTQTQTQTPSPVDRPSSTTTTLTTTSMAISSIMSPPSPLVRAARPRSPLTTCPRSPPPPSRLVLSNTSTQRRHPPAPTPFQPQSQSQPPSRPRSPPSRMVMAYAATHRHSPEAPSQSQPQSQPQSRPALQTHVVVAHESAPRHYPEASTQASPQSRPRSPRARLAEAKVSAPQHYPERPSPMESRSTPPTHIVVSSDSNSSRSYPDGPTQPQSRPRPVVHTSPVTSTTIAPPRRQPSFQPPPLSSPSPPPSPPAVLTPAHYDQPNHPLRPWRERSMSVDANSETSATNPALDALLHQVEIDRLQYERRCQTLREERMQLDLARQRIQVTKEKALARHELRLAGVPEHEIERAFPLG